MDTYLRDVPSKSINKLCIYSILKIFRFIIVETIKDALLFCTSIRLYKRVIFYVGSSNQYEAVKDIKNKINDSAYITKSFSTKNRILMFPGILLSPLFIVDFLFLYKKSIDSTRKILLYNADQYIFLQGMYIWWVIYIKIIKPQKVIFSNDHKNWCRLLNKVCRDNNIPTFYIQHASVTNNFPKLEFDVAILEGQDSFSKYGVKESSSIMILAGMAKYDKYINEYKKSNYVKNIGICLNLLDDIKLVDKLIEIINIEKYNLIIRPHPRDNRSYIKYLNKGISISDSKQKNSFEFLKNIDLVIAGETSIHLESVLMNVYPVYFNFNEINDRYDVYGYIDNGLVKDICENGYQVLRLIKKIDSKNLNIRNRAKKYNASIGTAYEGRTTDLVLRIINSYN